MSNRLDEPSEQALQRLGVSTYAIAVRRIILERPALDDLIGVPLGPQPVEVVRPADLVHLTFSFENMEFAAAGNAQTPPLLARRTKNRPAFLIVDFHAQHAIEHALFEVAPGYPVKAPPKPLQLGQGTPAPQDPDEGKPGYDLSTAAGLASLPHPPLWASLAGSTRLAFKVTTETLLYSEEGLIAAMRVLDLSVAPHAVPPVRKRLRYKWADVYASEAIDITHLLVAANAPSFRSQRARRGVESPQGATAASAELIALGRMQATARTLESRFGLDSALAAVTSANVGNKLGVAGVIEDIDVFVPFEVLPPLPAEPTENQTEHRAPVAPPDLAQREPARSRTAPPRWSTTAASSCGTPGSASAPGPDGKRDARRRGEADRRRADPGSPHDPGDLGARLRHPAGGRPQPELRLHVRRRRTRTSPAPPGTQDKPLVPHVAQQPRPDDARPRDVELPPRAAHQRRDWTPEAVPADRLMLTALGGWLDSRVQFETLPDGGADHRRVEAPRRPRPRPRGQGRVRRLPAARSGTGPRS